MRYASIHQRLEPPQCLQLVVGGQPYDIMLHQGQCRRLKGMSDAHNFGEEYRNASTYFWLFTGGNGSLRLNGRDFPFQHGTLAVAESGEAHTAVGEVVGDTTLRHAGFVLRAPGGELLTRPLHELLSLWSGEALPDIAFPIQLSDREAQHLAGLFDAYVSALVPRGMIHCFPAHKAMLDLFAFFVEHVYAPSAGSEIASPSPLMRVRLEIEQRYDEPLTLRDLARLASLSPGYLCRAFKRNFGTAPLAYQQELRLREAKRLLSTTNLRIAEVTAAVGFQSVYHFSRLFHKRVGCTASAYAARARA
ncbi:MAG: helix-turn-helix domain-containing protein [Planctomycetota bacterium]|jgi:AraC-like DNA-binding protein